MHVNPVSVVRIYNIGADDYVEVVNTTTQIFVAQDNIISIPLDSLANIVENHGQITLIADGEQQDGIVIFRPSTESEEFPLRYYIEQNGSISSSSNFRTTELVDMLGVKEYFITATTGTNTFVVCYAYDELRNPLKIILAGGKAYSNRKVTYDGTYRYIRVSGLNANDHSCRVIYNQRSRVIEDNDNK